MSSNNRWFGRRPSLFYPAMQDPLELQLELKLNELMEKEQNLKNREANLSQLEAGMEAQIRLINQQNLEIQNAEEALARREQVLESKTVQLNKKEKQLLEKEYQLNQREQAIQRTHEKTLRQAELAQSLDIRRQAMDEAVLRYRQERTNWENTVGSMPESNYRQNLENGMQSLVEHFGQTFQEMQALRNQIRELDSTIRECDWDVIRALCELHRRLESLNTEEALREADYLTMILKKHYQLQPIDPVLGSPYSNNLHERLNRERGGQFVVRCFSKGWQSNGDVVSKALVDTADSI